MNNNKGKLKSIVFAMVVAAGMLLPVSSFAQGGEKGGMFGRGSLFDKIEGLFDSDNDFQYEENAYGLFNQQPDRTGSGMDLGGMSQEDPAPLGSGLLIMVAAGAGYALLKKKEEKA